MKRVDQGLDGRVVFKIILNKHDSMVWTALNIVQKQGFVNVPGSIKFDLTVPPWAP